MGIYGNKYNKKDEIVNEGVISTILLILFGPYIAVLAIMIILTPIMKMVDKSNKDWKEYLLKRNPNVTDSLLKLVEALNKYISKEMGQDAKYVDFYRVTENNFKFKRPNKSDSNNKVYIYNCKLNCIKLLQDKTGCENSVKYFEKIGWDDPDADPAIPVECRKVITKFNNIIEKANKYLKLVGNTSMIKIEKTPEDFSKEWIQDSFYYQNDSFDMKYAYERIGSCIIVSFGDYSKIDLPEKTKKEVEKIINSKK